MPFLELVVNFIPNIIKSLTKAFPKGDNHKVNVVFDVLGFSALIILCSMWFDGALGKVEKMTVEQSLDVAIFWGGAFLFWLLFAIICYMTTLYKS